MKPFKYFSVLVILALLLSAFAPAATAFAQTANKADTPKTIVDTAAANPQFSTLVAAVKAAGLVETLSGSGPFTVFAPTDAAFRKLPEGTVEALLKDPGKLKAILTYHVVSGKVMSADVLKTASAVTVNGAPVVFTNRGGRVFVNNARVTTADVAASNGVIHVIDTVILPPDKDIVDTAAANPQFKTLVAAVQAAGLVDTLKGKGPYTIFAPTDAAFTKLGKATIDALLKEPEKLKSILLYHALPGAVYAASVPNTVSAATVNGADVLFTVRNGAAYINNARITTTDLLTTNGVIHVIDTVLLPSDKDIVDTASADPRFKTLVAAVKAAGLVETLKGSSPYTVFAPTDAAFAKLPKGTVDALIKDPEKLKSILLYHVINGKQYAGSVTKMASATTAGGADVAITRRGGSVYVNNARVTGTDILTKNGVIHVIDTVLLPPDKDIVDTAAANPQFKTLVAAVQAAGLAETLKGKGPYTIFAPTDAAFAKLPRGTVDALLKDPERLKAILLYHALPEKVYAGSISSPGSAKTTANGADVVFTARSGTPYINNARITGANILTTNGVIHVIDTVLLPPDKDLVDTAAANPQFKTLSAAVKAAGLAETLKGKGPYTIFAPTDAAFAKLPRGTVEALLKDPEKLKSILLYHAVSGKVYSSSALSAGEARTVNGAKVKFSVKNGAAYINNARITTTDILTTNGVIHVIDTVILPPSQ